MNLNKEWSLFLDTEMKTNNYIKLSEKTIYAYKNKIIFPKFENIFRAFNLLTPDEVKVVIIGQDPYHGVNQANGLAFSVSKECKIPPSLNNIFKELVDDMACIYPSNGNLESWAKNGVLLINTVLTVEEAKANSHKNFGWESFTTSIIKKLSKEYEGIVFVLWGNESKKKFSIIDASKHLILQAPHPSPLSSYRGFFGSKPFSKVNKYLKSIGKKEIDWCL